MYVLLYSIHRRAFIASIITSTDKFVQRTSHIRVPVRECVCVFEQSQYNAHITHSLQQLVLLYSMLLAVSSLSFGLVCSLVWCLLFFFSSVLSNCMSCSYGYIARNVFKLKRPTEALSCHRMHTVLYAYA